MPKNYGSNNLVRNEGFNGLGDPADDKTNDLYSRLFSAFRALTDVFTVGGQVVLSTLGKGLSVTEGAGAKLGVATLVAGTVTVTNANVTANSRIFLSRKTSGGTVGTLSYTVSAGVSFTITSSSATDTSVINWFIVEAA